MPDLDFRVESAAAVPFAAAPLLGFRIGVSNAHASEPVYSVLLRCQIQLEVTRRRYNEQEQERLVDLFASPFDVEGPESRHLTITASIGVAIGTRRDATDPIRPATPDSGVTPAQCLPNRVSRPRRGSAQHPYQTNRI